MHELNCKNPNYSLCDCGDRYEYSDEYQKSLVPVVGMPATYAINGDEHPYTVTAVSPNGARIELASDRCIGGNKFIPAVGGKRNATRRQNGRYRFTGQDFGFIYLGIRSTHMVREF